MEYHRSQMMLRWSLLTGGLIALFWVIYYFINGSVPVVSTLKWSDTQTITLPFLVSRWFDILIGPLYSIIFVYLFISNKIKENEELGFALVVALFVGLVVALFVGLVVAPGFGLVFALVFALAVALGFALGFALVFGLGFGLVFALVFALGFGLGAGLAAVLAAGLAAVLAAALGFGLKIMFRIFTIRFWIRIWNWLMVR